MGLISEGFGPPPGLTSPSSALIKTVEWEMLDKSKFFPMSMVSSFTVRCFLYPLTLVRTRLQVQRGNEVYKGTYDAGRKILQHEGVRGLYRGFFVSAFQVVSGVCYVSTYEGVRHILDKNGVTDNKAKAFLGGGCASVVGQTIIVPFDVISQHLMLLGQLSAGKGSVNAELKASLNPFNVKLEGRSKAQIAADITRSIYKQDGFRGFYRGYLASLSTYVPSSASWWTFYHMFQEIYEAVIPPVVPHIALQCAAAMSAGCSSCILTNPLDLVRTRVQVQRLPILATVRLLWETERFNVFSKGLTARMTSSVIYSLAIILGYETVKRWSVHEQYKDLVKW
jgi:solute carrier family 25 protein 44